MVFISDMIRPCDFHHLQFVVNILKLLYARFGEGEGIQ